MRNTGMDMAKVTGMMRAMDTAKNRAQRSSLIQPI
jgi:hypothetical protein